MAGNFLNWGNLKKVGALLRDHRPGQVVNTLRYAWHAVRGFPTVHLPYEPVWLQFFITSRCNLRCAHCQFQAPDSPCQPLDFADMTMETYCRILDRYPRTSAIVLAGGEPLVHPRFFDMAREAGRRRIKVHIPTNGTLLASHIDELLDCSIAMLNLSLYGVDAQGFAALTGASPDVFDRTVSTAAEIARRRTSRKRLHSFRASFICTKSTMHDAVRFARLCEEIGFDEVRLVNLCPFGIPGYGESETLCANDADARAFIESLRRERFRIPVILPSLCGGDDAPRACTMPFRSIPVDADGHIGPCCVVGPWRKFGNVFDDGAWNGPSLVEMRRRLLDRSTPLPTLCAYCEMLVPGRERVGG